VLEKPKPVVRVLMRELLGVYGVAYREVGRSCVFRA
jgi:hypothetical protein